MTQNDSTQYELESLRAQVATLDQVLEALQRTVTEQSTRLEMRNKELAESERQKSQTLEQLHGQLELIRRQQLAIRDLATPILEIWDDVLALPLIGIIDTTRGAEIRDRLLQEVLERQARFVLIDVTGVEVIDTKTADHFVRLIRSVELVGARCVLTGIRAAVAQTMADLGIHLDTVKTLRNMKHGLRECIRMAREAKAEDERA
jgi:rsbT co-antagonist protein RsbR